MLNQLRICFVLPLNNSMMTSAAEVLSKLTLSSKI